MAPTAAPTPTSTERILMLRLHVEKDTHISPGTWYDDFLRVKAEAEKTGNPLFAMWINPGCGYCKRFCDNAISPRFSAWMKESGVYFWLGSRTDKAGTSGPGWEFVLRQNADHTHHYFPLIAIWQSVNGTVIHDCRVSGRTLEQEKTGEEGLDNTLNGIYAALKDPPHKLADPADPNAKPAQQQGGGCPGGHPHLKALQEIARIIAPFVPSAGAQVQAAPSSLAIRMNPALALPDRNRRLQAIADNGGHCPCQKDRTPETLCLCGAFMGQDKAGLCPCGLFEKYVRK